MYRIITTSKKPKDTGITVDKESTARWLINILNLICISKDNGSDAYAYEEIR